ncbi:MAG TPA: ATP-binding protein, partial [Armatimonadota bacterium]
ETILIRGRKDPDAAARFAQKIMDESDRLTALSEDLLDLAKIEAGLSVIRRETFLLSEVVDQVLGEYSPVRDQRGLDITSSVPPSIAVHADRDAVYQILLNLVDNAAKYTLTGGTIGISAESTTDRVVVRVSDTGIGIPAEDTMRIFERFYRVDKARSRDSGGTGLGLSIVKHLVEEHGGRITVESVPGKGSTFTFTLPKAV